MEQENRTNPEKNTPEAVTGPRTVRRRKKKRFSAPMITVLILCGLVFVGSMTYIVRDLLQSGQISGELDHVIESAFGSGSRLEGVYIDPNDPNAGTIGEEDQTGVNTEDRTEHTFTIVGIDEVDVSALPYLKQPDWNRLQNSNGDTKAWLYMPSTASVTGLPFDIAVVQTDNNSFYLNHSFSKQENENGWVYADYRNDMNTITNNYNTIFYGHARSYKMFGGLKYLNEKPEWYNNGNNHFIYINTPTERTIWQIFSWYETNVEHYYIKTNFASGQDFVDFVNDLQSRNEIAAFARYNFTENSRIITFSTCKGLNPNNRVAMHAVLVKSESIG